MASESIAHSDSEPIQAQGIIVKDRKHVTILTQTKYCVYVPALAAHTVMYNNVMIKLINYHSTAVLLVNLRNRTGEERRRQTLCDNRDNKFV